MHFSEYVILSVTQTYVGAFQEVHNRNESTVNYTQKTAKKKKKKKTAIEQPEANVKPSIPKCAEVFVLKESEFKISVQRRNQTIYELKLLRMARV